MIVWTILLIILALFYRQFTKITPYLRYYVFHKKGIQSFKEQVSIYHFQYSLKQQGKFLLFILAAISFVSYTFQMSMDRILLLNVVVAIVLPYIVVDIAKYEFQHKDFLSLTATLQYFLSQYKIEPHLKKALEGSAVIANEELQQCLTTVITRLEQEGKVNVFQEELMAYKPHFIIANITNFICNLEQYGASNFENGIDLLIEDVEQWIADCHASKQTLLQIRNRICLLCLFSLIIANFAMQMSLNVEFSVSSVIYQNMLFVYFISLVLTLQQAFHLHHFDWIEPKECLYD